MSLMNNLLISAGLWIVIQGGLTLAAHHFLGSLDPMLKRGIWMVTMVVVSVVGFWL